MASEDIQALLEHVGKVVNRVSDDAIVVEGIRLTREEFSALYKAYGYVRKVAQALRVNPKKLNKVLASKKHREFYRALKEELKPIRRANRNRRYYMNRRARREGGGSMPKPPSQLPPPRPAPYPPPVKGNAPRHTAVDALRQALTDLDA